MLSISIFSTRRTHVLIPLHLPLRAPPPPLPPPPPAPRSLPTPFPAAARARLPPPPQPGCPSTRRPRAPASSPWVTPGPARVPFLPQGPPQRRAGPGRPRPPWWAPHRQVGESGPAAPWPMGGLGERGWAGKQRPGMPPAQLAEEASTEPRPPPPREEPLRLEPPAPPQPRAETDQSADLRLLILTAGNKQCAGAGGWDGT